MKQPRDHELRTAVTATDYVRAVRLADLQDRSLSEFQRHALRRYMDWIEAQHLPRESRADSSLDLESDG